jgi:hypothetical protein
MKCKVQEIKVQEIRDENMTWNAMEMRHETKWVSNTKHKKRWNGSKWKDIVKQLEFSKAITKNLIKKSWWNSTWNITKILRQN